jgi:aspartyl-tRNA(Asn)/glutamyl-tRNA(Gln) amidotransferase subunit C
LSAALVRSPSIAGAPSLPHEPVAVDGTPPHVEFTAVSTLSRTDLAHLARLARLAVTDEELDRFAGQLDAVLDAVAQVGKADVDDVPPTTHAVPMTNVLREDVVEPCLDRDEVLAAAPAAEDGRFRVPRILGEEA